MSTKLLMTITSVVLGVLGLAGLFAPQELLAALRAPTTEPLPLVVQLLGVLYVSFALVNWTAKDSTIGGIYGRPISFGNFIHFALGALVLAKYQLSAPAPGLLSAVLLGYAVLAGVFGWLVFRHTGIAVK